jgi:hypothetical protein
MVYFTLALALFQQGPCDDVAEHLASGVTGMDGHVPNRASFTRARQRPGPQVMEEVFRALAAPLAPGRAGRGVLVGMRIAAVDGLVLGAPGTAASRQEPAARSTQAGNRQATRRSGGDADRGRHPRAGRRGDRRAP